MRPGQKPELGPGGRAGDEDEVGGADSGGRDRLHQVGDVAGNALARRITAGAGRCDRRHAIEQPGRPGRIGGRGVENHRVEAQSRLFGEERPEHVAAVFAAEKFDFAGDGGAEQDLFASAR